eukprot:scaffold40890_cov66-Phaeocystis_antarctica.AAC.7
MRNRAATSALVGKRICRCFQWHSARRNGFLHRGLRRSRLRSCRSKSPKVCRPARSQARRMHGRYSGRYSSSNSMTAATAGPYRGTAKGRARNLPPRLQSTQRAPCWHGLSSVSVLVVVSPPSLTNAITRRKRNANRVSALFRPGALNFLCEEGRLRPSLHCVRALLWVASAHAVREQTRLHPEATVAQVDALLRLRAGGGLCHARTLVHGAPLLQGPSDARVAVLPGRARRAGHRAQGHSRRPVHQAPGCVLQPERWDR